MDHLTAPDGRHAGDEPAPGVCPFTISRPVMRQRWERLTFLHWPYDPAVIQRLLPAGLSAEPFDGTAWVGLVPFSMRVATPGGRRVPWASNFCETNVRTYVRDEAGRPGIWFLSLDAARLGAVITARTTYRLPYFWSAMRLGQRGAEFRYVCRRRWPGPRPALSRVHVSVGEPFGPAEAGQRDHFLTARWRLFSVMAGRLVSARACHQPWPLYHATAPVVDGHLLTAAGLPGPQGEPLVHYSPGVDVAIGLPERLAGSFSLFQRVRLVHRFAAAFAGGSAGERTGRFRPSGRGKSRRDDRYRVISLNRMAIAATHTSQNGDRRGAAGANALRRRPRRQ